MREILFKGKRLDNGEWIWGSLSTADKKCFVVYDNFYEVSDCCGIHLAAYRYFEVAPETVCQYIGLTDWNDKKIFIGDILKGKHGNYIIVPARNGWQLKRLKNNGEIGANSTAAYLHLYEIIGNIHDKE